MQQAKKVVLAYSGGVDTSVCIPYLKNEYGISEVVTFVADLGQGEDLELIRQKALIIQKATMKLARLKSILNFLYQTKFLVCIIMYYLIYRT